MEQVGDKGSASTGSHPETINVEVFVALHQVKSQEELLHAATALLVCDAIFSLQASLLLEIPYLYPIQRIFGGTQRRKQLEMLTPQGLLTDLQDIAYPNVPVVRL